MSTPTVSPTTAPTLNAFDRCDRCGARARVRVVLRLGGELLLCGHHGRQHQAALTELGAEFHLTGAA